MTIFYFYNTFYIAFDYSNQATIIFIVSVTVILSFLIIGGFVINEMSDISHHEKIARKNQESKIKKSQFINKF